MPKRPSDHLKRPIPSYNHPGQDLRLIQYIQEIPDERGCYCNFKHPLISIVFIALVSALCGANNWQEVVVVGQNLRDWISRFVILPHGIPSEDTFERVFAMIRADAFNQFLTKLMSIFRDRIEGDIISFDGKSLRGTAEKGIGTKALHILNAWSGNYGLSLGQLAVDEKSNEITAMPFLMEILELKGCIITADALNTQKNIAAKAIELEADYALPVKDNHPTLKEDIELLFSDAISKGFKGIDADQHETVEKNGGRIEQRKYYVIDADELPEKEQWAGVRSLGMVIRERSSGNKISTEMAYYILSFEVDAKLFEKCSRGHWGIENSLHWRLDVILREDQSRYRDKNGAQNLAVLRKIVLSALSRDKSTKRSISSKRLAAATDPVYREMILKYLF